MRLFGCSLCGLVFKNPSPTAAALRDYYATLAEGELWRHATTPPAWPVLARALEENAGGSVLDVGCFRGDLAQWLGSRWHHFGVEPSREARRVAEKRGVRVLGETLESIEERGDRFDAVVFSDVIEHLPHPADAVAAAWRQTKRGGQLLFVTGSPDATPWLLARGRYWYTVFPEHIVFCGPNWFRWIASRLGGHSELIARVPTTRASPWTRLKEAIRSVQYLLSRRRAASEEWVVWWTTAADHVVVRVRRPAEPRGPGNGAGRQR